MQEEENGESVAKISVQNIKSRRLTDSLFGGRTGPHVAGRAGPERWPDRIIIRMTDSQRMQHRCSGRSCRNFSEFSGGNFRPFARGRPVQSRSFFLSQLAAGRVRCHRRPTIGADRCRARRHPTDMDAVI